MPRGVHLHRAGLTARLGPIGSAPGSELARGWSRATPSPVDEQPRRGDEPGVRHHAVVGPHRALLDVPGAPQHLEGLGHPEGLRRHGGAQRGHLGDRRQVGRAGSRPGAAPRRWAQGTPRLGQVEHDAVEVHARRCPGRRRAPRPGTCASGPAHAATLARAPAAKSARTSYPTTSAPARSSAIDSAPDPTPASSTRMPGPMSAAIRMAPRSFG